MKTIEIAKPSEEVGRETLSRYDMQFQAAAYAALEILEGGSVDCVYCDHHNDFVVRRLANGKPSYHFFQVKTKGKPNHQWSPSQVFAVKGRGQKSDSESLRQVRESFAGKLLAQGISFDDACCEATLLSNVFFDDDVVGAVDQLRKQTPSGKVAKFLSDNFSAIFNIDPALDDAKALELLAKFSIRQVTYIGKERDHFSGAARAAIYKYSEIDLTYYETHELANSLVDLVYHKSRTPLEGIAPENIASRVGIQLDDLLGVLSISRAAYDALRRGENPKALKEASVLKRWLAAMGADDNMIEYAAQQRVNWDLWLRNARHIYSPLELADLLAAIEDCHKQWLSRGSTFAALNELLQRLAAAPAAQSFAGLDRSVFFGAIASIIVRVYSR